MSGEPLQHGDSIPSESEVADALREAKESRESDDHHRRERKAAVEKIRANESTEE